MFSSFSQLFWLTASASDRLRVEVLFKVFFEAGCDQLLCSVSLEVIAILRPVSFYCRLQLKQKMIFLKELYRRKKKRKNSQKQEWLSLAVLRLCSGAGNECLACLLSETVQTVPPKQTEAKRGSQIVQSYQVSVTIGWWS